MSTPTAKAASSPRPTLLFLDGIRGLAALSVVLFHSFLFTGLDGEAERGLPHVGWFVGYGYLGVPVFIVLSGYVLMLPLTRSPSLTYSRGVQVFLRRRARRILPPYFAALGLSLALIVLIPVLRDPRGTAWAGKVPVTLPGLLSHLVLVQDVSAGTINQINGPLWSIAVEWQIYFLMPLVLIPLWRRMHPAVLITLLLVITTGAGVAGFAPWAHPWLIALFAAGMLAAQASAGNVDVPWLRPLALTAAVGLPLVLLALVPVLQSRVWLTEVMAGCAFAFILAQLGRRSFQGRRFGGQSLLESRLLTRLGLVSYSVYLLHSPLLALGNMLLLPLGLPAATHYLCMTFIVAPAAIAVCVGFYWLVERHFKNQHQLVASAPAPQPATAPTARPTYARPRSRQRKPLMSALMRRR